jgi:hypothetical protein
MKAKPKATRERPLRVSIDFDEAIKRTLEVKPPEGGWKDYETQTKKSRKRRAKKAA